jgi:S1-C subfamily serine protease
VDDIIIAVNDEKISNATELRNAIGLKGSGENVTINYIRDGDTRTTTAKLGRANVASAAGGDIHPGLTGAELATYRAANGAEAGVEITTVADGSAAAQRGLRDGDIVTQVNRRAIRNLAQFREVAVGNRILFLRVERGDRSLMLQIR